VIYEGLEKGVYQFISSAEGNNDLTTFRSQRPTWRRAARLRRHEARPADTRGRRLWRQRGFTPRVARQQLPASPEVRL